MIDRRVAARVAIPFLPASGGQSAIVHDDDRLTYDSLEDAVEVIDRVLSGRSLQRELRFGRGEVERRCGREHFEDRVAEAAVRAQGRPGEGTTRPARRVSETVTTHD